MMNDNTNDATNDPPAAEQQVIEIQDVPLPSTEQRDPVLPMEPTQQSPPTTAEATVPTMQPIDQSVQQNFMAQAAHAIVPPETVEYLKSWMLAPEHVAHPYPTEQERIQIMRDTGIEVKQLTNWFVNNRKRFWKPLMEGKVRGAVKGPAASVEDVTVNSALGPKSGPAAKKGKKKQEKKLEKKTNRRRSSGNLRPARDRPKIYIIDDEPDRLTNPLVDLPKADSDHPNAAELYVWSDIVFHRLDTYPLSYYARLLGFDVPPPVDDTHVGLNPATIPLRRDQTYKKIPPLGTFANVWKRQEGDEILDYIDPMYQTICHQGLRPELIKRATLNPLAPRFLSKECLNMAKEIFENLPDLQIMDIAGDFGCCTSDHDSISYQFAWYHLLDEANEAPLRSTNYGMPSASSMLKKKRVSELIIFINCYRSGIAPVSLGKKNDQSAALSSPQQHDKTHNREIEEDDESSFHATEPLLAQAVAEAVGVDNKSTDVSTTLAKVGNVNTAHVGGVEEMSDVSCIHDPKEHVTDDGKPEEATPEATLASESNNTSLVKDHNHSLIPNYVGAMSKDKLIVLTALALEHARACDIWYGLVQVPKHVAHVLVEYFRMVQLHDDNGIITLVCDLKKCSFKYAFLLFKTPTAEEYVPPVPSSRDRMLVRLPNMEDARYCIKGSSTTPRKLMTRPKKANIFFTGVGSALQNIAFGIRLNTADGTLQILDKDGNSTDEHPEIPNFVGEPAWDVLKSFPIPTPAPVSESHPHDRVLSLLNEKQRELGEIEGGMESKLRDLLVNVLKARTQFEKDAEKRAERMRILAKYQSVLERRKEIDLAWQSQRDQDMDAVCEICNDGEVTPDNQILFCESCNVAVHQICYGIERVPEGDYYCIACRHFGREKIGIAVAKQLERGVSQKIFPSPLPIFCELCPRKQGAFIRTDTSNHANDNESKRVLSRWVHVVCAKWQGLNFVHDQCTDCVEDVLPLKIHFKVLNLSCMLCKSNRGAFNKCRESGCEKYLHVSCARSSGLCEVIHGENCMGPVECNPWSLLCPNHSGSDKSAIPTGTVTIEQLELATKEFPPEKLELLKPKAFQGFHKMLGNERKEAMKDRKFEAELVEILLKKNHGVRCESCFQYEEDGKSLTRCIACSVVFCDSCTSDADGVCATNRTYKCPACKVVEEKQKTSEEYEVPRCSLCVQKGGWLRAATAVPMKTSVWKSRKDKIKEWPKTLFAKPFWCHQLCQMWQEKVYLNPLTLTCNCNDVVMTHGRGFINEKHMCELCGNKEGMKIQCAEPCCRGWGEIRKRYTFHATCSRQAGLEVENRPTEDGSGYEFYAKCFRHGSNMFNLRARLEDLIEIEKRRSGKNLESKDARAMSFAHASRLLNSAILVMCTLGWSWRWAEWWVLYRDSWEPLLEPGQKEEDMTNEEKRIVESTPESRCEDARKCRLAALGAALRNRSFDTVEHGDTVMLDRALRAMLHTKSLVGPLDAWEIDFFAEWLGIAYRSKSRLLGFGSDNIVIKPSRGCVLEGPEHTPKYELGTRRLPGSQEFVPGQVYETEFNDSDDFLKPERFKDGTLVTEEALKPDLPPKLHSKKRKAEAIGIPGTKPSKRGRPRKSIPVDETSGTPVQSNTIASVEEVDSDKCEVEQLNCPLVKATAVEPNALSEIASPKRKRRRVKREQTDISLPDVKDTEETQCLSTTQPLTPGTTISPFNEPEACEELVRFRSNNSPTTSVSRYVSLQCQQATSSKIGDQKRAQPSIVGKSHPAEKRKGESPDDRRPKASRLGERVLSLNVQNEREQMACRRLSSAPTTIVGDTRGIVEEDSKAEPTVLVASEQEAEKLDIREPKSRNGKQAPVNVDFKCEPKNELCVEELQTSLRKAVPTRFVDNAAAKDQKSLAGRRIDRRRSAPSRFARQEISKRQAGHRKAAPTSFVNEDKDDDDDPEDDQALVKSQAGAIVEEGN